MSLNPFTWTRESVKPYADKAARVLALPHALFTFYCCFNLASYFGLFLQLGWSDFTFFASYLTMFFAFLGSACYVLHILGKTSLMLASLGCIQAAVCSIGLNYFEPSSVMLGNTVLFLHGVSVFVLKYTWIPPDRYRNMIS